MNPGDHDRRIGKRRQVQSIPMAWCRDPKKPRADDAQTSPDGRIVELSVSGAGLIAVTHPNLRVGQVVLIACAGTTGRLTVRRIDPDVYPGESYYGVEFTEPDGNLTKTLQTTFLGKAIEAPESYVPRD